MPSQIELFNYLDVVVVEVVAKLLSAYSDILSTFYIYRKSQQGNFSSGNSNVFSLVKKKFQEKQKEKIAERIITYLLYVYKFTCLWWYPKLF